MDFIIIFGIVALIIIIPVIAFFIYGLFHIPKVQVAALCREMSIMIDAGMPLLRIFKILSTRVSHDRLRAIVTEIMHSVENGNTVAAAMANHPKVFDEMMIGIIKVGETGGVLDESLRRLSTHLERVIRLRRKLVVASIYPLLTVLVLITVLLVLIIFVFPKMLEPLKSNPRIHLPVLTQIVDNMGQYVIGHWPFLLILVVLIGAAIAVLRKTKPGKIFEDYMKLKTPVVGSYLGTRVVAARVATTFSTLVHCGIPIISCLRIIAQTQTNSFVSASFRRTADEVERGGSLIKPLEESGLYPPLMIDMLTVGDESGTMDSVLEKIAVSFTEEVDSALEAFTQIQEALMIISLGGIVLLVALAAYLPYFQMWQLVG